MYDYIKGILTDKNYPYCTVENNGIGYRLLVNSRILSQIGEIDDSVKIYVKLIISLIFPNSIDLVYRCY